MLLHFLLGFIAIPVQPIKTMNIPPNKSWDICGGNDIYQTASDLNKDIIWAWPLILVRNEIYDRYIFFVATLQNIMMRFSSGITGDKIYIDNSADGT